MISSSDREQPPITTRGALGRNGMPSVRRASLSFLYQNPLCAFLPFIVAMDLNLFRTPGAKYRILLLLLACVCCLYLLGPLIPILFDVARNTKEARKLNYGTARIEKPVMPPLPSLHRGNSIAGYLFELAACKAPFLRVLAIVALRPAFVRQTISLQHRQCIHLSRSVQAVFGISRRKPEVP